MQGTPKYFVGHSILVLCIGFRGISVKARSPAEGSWPNILIFIADDMGWRDAGAYGNEVIQTPSIDRLAAEGLLFEQAFLTTAQCSPSRISILTGLYPHSTGAKDLHMPLPEDTRMVPDYLSDWGYYTGHMQKTPYGPHGEAQFDWYSENLSDAFPDFLDEAGKSPFFLWVGFSDPHRPYGDAPAVHDPEQVHMPPYLADTPETRAELARYYDEIARWPDHIEAGSRCSGLVSVIDLAPTLLELAGHPIPDPMQGQSILPVLSDPTLPGRRYVFSERN